ncbi:MAG TPA: Rrf2 family transcriptional regulator [Tetragenococcus sp.]|nr:Rrf2 family transcriptional regulator [Tetragenococcus sp.]
MKASTQFSDAIHIMAYIAIYKNTDRLSSTAIAESVKTNPSNVRKIMALLKKADLISTDNGRATPSLAKKADKITFYDIYSSLMSDQYLFRIDTSTEQKCVIGGNIQEVLAKEYSHLQDVVEEEMKQTSLGSVLHKLALLEKEKRTGNEELIKDFL